MTYGTPISWNRVKVGRSTYQKSSVYGWLKVYEL